MKNPQLTNPTLIQGPAGFSSISYRHILPSSIPPLLHQKYVLVDPLAERNHAPEALKSLLAAKYDVSDDPKGSMAEIAWNTNSLAQPLSGSASPHPMDPTAPRRSLALNARRSGLGIRRGQRPNPGSLRSPGVVEAPPTDDGVVEVRGSSRSAWVAMGVLWRHGRVKGHHLLVESL